jgi:Coenzyme PQQ synthesis protein D (PqqD)
MNLQKLEQTILESSVIKASSEQISSDLGGEAVILNLKSGVYHGLNEVGARVWNLIQNSCTVSEIKQTLLEEYEVEIEQCHNDLMALLAELLTAELIVINNETST